MLKYSGPKVTTQLTQSSRFVIKATTQLTLSGRCYYSRELLSTHHPHLGTLTSPHPATSPVATPQATQPQRGHAPPISHSPCTFLSLGCPHGQSGCNSLPFVPRGGAPGITLTGSRLLQTAPLAAQSPPKVPTSLSNSVVMSTEALVIIPNTPVHYRSERFER